ncbi:MAG: hypothetical protein HKN49_13350 [Gammaproteobacteria bacterium]|nr:hypothetical protein [Gammaproteobacteria bacterium]
MLIDRVTLTETDDERELSGYIDGFRLFIRVPRDVKLVASPEPFIATCFLEALSRGGTLQVDSDLGVSPVLQSNLDTLQLIYREWNHDFKKVTLECADAEPRTGIPGVATMYSAGVDSAYTFVRHYQDITHLVRIFGLDFNDHPDETAAIVAADRSYADEHGKTYIPVRTNMRVYVDERNIDYASFWGFPLYAVSLALGIEQFIFPSSYTYSELEPASGHPLTDPLWANEQIQIEHDVCIRRSDKLRGIIDSSHAMERLHVCWREPVDNCGTCSKCVRTAVALRVLGARTDAIPDDNVLEGLRNLNINDESGLTFFVDNLALAEERGDDEVARLLRKEIARYRRSKIIPELDHLFLGGMLRRLHRRLRKPQWLSTIGLTPKQRRY